MIKTTNMMLESLKDYANPKAKLARMVKNRECFPIVKGLYETERNVPAHLLAGSIYGPSYISFEYALGHYGLIPERVVVVTCATFEKKKKKRYETMFGTFSYRDVPAAAFPLALRLVQEGEYFYRIAEPEKALCDEIYIQSPVANNKEMAALLLDDLRIEENQLAALDVEKIARLAPHYHSTNVRRLAAFLRKVKK